MIGTFISLLGIFAIAGRSAAPILGNANPKALLNNYIIVLKDTVSDEQFATHMQYANRNLATGAFKLGSFKGYAIMASPDELVALSKLDEVIPIRPSS